MGERGVLLLRIPLYSSLLWQPTSVLLSTDCGQVSFRFPVLDPPSPSAPLGCPPHVLPLHTPTFLSLMLQFFWYPPPLFDTPPFLFQLLAIDTFPPRHSAWGHASWWAARLFRTGERMDVPFFCFCLSLPVTPNEIERWWIRSWTRWSFERS